MDELERLPVALGAKRLADLRLGAVDDVVLGLEDRLASYSVCATFVIMNRA